MWLDRHQQKQRNRNSKKNQFCLIGINLISVLAFEKMLKKAYFLLPSLYSNKSTIYQQVIKMENGFFFPVFGWILFQLLLLQLFVDCTICASLKQFIVWNFMTVQIIYNINTTKQRQRRCACLFLSECLDIIVVNRLMVINLIKNDS